MTGEGGAASRLSALTGVAEDQCAQVIRRALLTGTRAERLPETGKPPLAFRLHQFISRGDSVYATLEPAAERYLTTNGQVYKPGSREHILLPLMFCRECGQEYYAVTEGRNGDGQGMAFMPRDPDDAEGGTDGFLHIASGQALTDTEIMDTLPDDWIEDVSGTTRIRRDRQKDFPRQVCVATDGRIVSQGEGGIPARFMRAPFRFCLQCGVEYDPQQKSDFGKLATLSSEGRSTATTILSIATLQQLGAVEDIATEPRKILSFTDNRQDASLQAGHFNDFVEVALLRAALFKAVSAAPNGITHEALTQQVIDALALPLTAYAANPEVRFAALTATHEALRKVLGYRVYRDLRRGWRINMPNLEQVDLLKIEYISLTELCEAEDIWADKHEALRDLSSKQREEVAHVGVD